MLFESLNAKRMLFQIRYLKERIRAAGNIFVDAAAHDN